MVENYNLYHPKYNEFYEYFMNIEWDYDDGFNKIFLKPEKYNHLYERLSELRRENLIPKTHRSVIFQCIRLGETRYKECLIKKANIPRVEAQKFIGKKDVREFIFKRDGYKCLCCGSVEKLSIDHIEPVNNGGINEIDNLQTLCRSCNSRKRDTYKDYR